ncbi:MAG: hypothetical protein KDH90_23350, partial [Anaerolineae bacterium]|nr:hypothetical protein [Anaerolineae bacterium]
QQRRQSFNGAQPRLQLIFNASSTLPQQQDVVLASTWLSPQIRLAISRLSARRYIDGFFQPADRWFRP